jgi:TonB-dependent SusC/RagA subfamily outer membrane receptor
MKKQIILLLSIFFLSFKINSQEHKITIKVKDINNKAVPGAIILFDNVKQKQWTNSKGVFKKRVEKTPNEISAFHPKIGISKIKYNNKSNFVIILKKGNDNDIFKPAERKIISSRFTNIYDYLRGKVSGVNVTADNQITIRGYNSINGNMTPLFILDGNAISEDMFAFIMPDDIKSVTVLKGPDSAVYGIRAANGVIIVNTNQSN